MPGKLGKKSGSTWRKDRVFGDAYGAATDRNARRTKQKEINKLLKTHPCGACVACCQLHTFPGIHKPEGALCQYAMEGVKQGCRVYSKRPQGCRDYFCAYRFGLLGDTIELRPDQLGIMFDVAEGAPPGVLLLEARETRLGAIEDSMTLLREIAEKGIVLRLHELDRSRIMGAAEKLQELKKWEKRHLPIVAQ